MTDRELLKLAAKAAGISLYIEPMSPGCQFEEDRKLYSDLRGSVEWNPLTDDGDALRLAVKLMMTVLADPGIDASVAAQIDPPTSPLTSVWADELAEPDPYAATRRAIVRAAAEIGKQL